MRWVLIALAASGCGFSIDTEGSVPGDDQQPPPPEDVDASVVARMCSTTDPSLRLCIDFDDATDLARDQLAHTVTALNLVPMVRAPNQPAVTVNTTSVLHVRETSDLDIADNLTVSLWVSVTLDGIPLTTTTSRWLYDNNTQYFAQVRAGGIVRCGSGNEEADSPPIPADGSWHHVACTYRRDEIRVYIDGNVAGCESVSDRALPTGGMDGLAIGANVSGGAGGPKFTEQFVGGLDNVQVFARLLGSTELCTAAGRTACVSQCL